MKGSQISIFFALSLIFHVGRLMAGEGLRTEISLNGEWLVMKVQDLNEAPRGEWTPCKVPSYLSGPPYECAWLKRVFQADAAWAGRRVKIHFGAVKYNSAVLLNGQKVGGNFGGYEPFEVDITQVVKLGSANELLVGVHDWTGVLSEKVDFSGIKDWHELRARPKNAILSPIGGIFTLYGIWEDVTLRILPPVHVEDVFVRTSVRQKTLAADVTVANEDTKPVEVVVKGQVLDAADGKPVLNLEDAKVTLQPGESQTVTISRVWPNPKLWTHLSPNLYTLVVRLDNAAQLAPATPLGLDACTTRFGFREFWTEKDAFYLNGVKINLLATSTWPQHRIVERQAVEETYRAVKEANCVAFRLHTQPWQKLYYDVADEMGLLIVVEGAIWCDQNYRFSDPTFWENYATHLRRTIKRLRNHPSIIMWSLENEILHCAPAGKESPAKNGLASLGRQVKQWDPTRPITYEADLDPLGVADVIGLHYPYPEYPRVTQYPNACYWMDEDIPMKRPLVDDEREKWRWDRKKPLYIGEFLWAPARDPSPDTVFYGDEAYASPGRYHALAKAESWRMQIEAYRWYGVNGICPWTMFEGPGGVLAREKNPLWAAVRDKFHPNAVFLKEYDTRFYAGDEVVRTLTAYNDTFSDGDFTLVWSLVCGEKTISEGKESFALRSAERRTVTVRLQAPPVTEPTDALFRIALLRDKVCFEDTKQFHIFPRGRLNAPADCKIGLYDPPGSTGSLLAREGLTFIPMSSLANLPDDLQILIIGERVLKPALSEKKERVIGRPNSDRDRLLAFVRGGGRVLVLPQSEYPDNLLPAQLSAHSSTMTFPQIPGHPVLRDVSNDDLKFWRGDHLVSMNEIARASTHGGRAIVLSGSEAGLAHSPLMEIPRGKGVFLLCQMRILEKIGTEPVARRLLQNALNYLAAWSPTTRVTCLISDSDEFKRVLSSLQIRFEDLTGGLEGSDLSRYGLAICCGSMKELIANQKKLRSWVESGGRVLFHALKPQDAKGLNSLFPKEAALHPHRGRVGAINTSDHMTSGWTHESLYWLGRHEGPGHARTPLADGVADYALVSKATGSPLLVLKAPDMAIEGHIVHVVGDHVVMATNGSVSKDIEIPEDGRYGVTITAQGSPVENVWPLMEVALDGEQVDVVSVPSRDWTNVSVAAEMKRGTHTLRVSFINDASKPGEDRNLAVKQVEISRMPAGAEGFIALTKPAFVARFDIGKGCVVVDEILWDTESRNAQKAMQYAQGLLVNLGADFEDVIGDTIGPEEMRENKEMVHFHRSASQVALASAGYVSISAKFASSGRYTFELVARGTPLDNIYPIVDVLLDGRKVGTIELTSDGWRSYPLDVEVAEGEHEIRLVFTNDQWRPPEDRNLYIQKLLVSRH